MTRLWIATTNQGKLNEFRNLLSNHFEIHSTLELPNYSPPPETGQTFLDNARLKARSMKAMKPGEWVVADDSGLEVEGLGNMPGVHSARYAGPKASDAENNAKLLKMVSIRTATKRDAKFKCVLVVFDPAGVEHILEGEVTGTIAVIAKGKQGFGYDPVFVPTGQTQTFAELGVAFKNRVSHRAAAIQKLIPLAAAAPDISQQ
jgi:XTP/dITP diphosphohydrolase